MNNKGLLVKYLKKEIESVKTENNTLRKKILELNQKTNLFKLKKIIHRHHFHGCFASY